MHVGALTLHAVMCLHIVYICSSGVLETVVETCFMLDCTIQRVKGQIQGLDKK
jgi:hypothetical protein